MASPRARAFRSLVLIALVIGALWGVIGWRGYEPLLGLDLRGGISVVMIPKAGQPTDDASLDQAVDIIRNRVDALGVAEPDITRQGSNILVQLPGIQQQDRALKLIGTTAKLRFRPVLGQPAQDAKNIPKCGDVATYPVDDPKKEVVFCFKQGDASAETWPVLRLGPVALEGDDVAGANAQAPSQESPSWAVNLELTGTGSKKFEDVTGKLACPDSATRQLAIVLDRVIESAPEVDESVQCNEGLSGTATITGQFSEREAKDLALVLRYGALPVELEPSTVTTISPTLGKESLRNGLLAAVIGLGIVFVYVALFYRALGVLIWLGIAVHGAFTFAVVILLGRTAGFALSLAGLAGLIVSLGIAADSFIVYFERIKDEVARGRSVRAAVDRAWPSARRTIWAADLVTALAALVLYLLAVGSVRGFALMLGLSTALDIFVAYLFMHPAVSLMANTFLLRRSRTLGVHRAGRGGAVAEGGTA